jgi:DNA end-binding protein Ku
VAQRPIWRGHLRLALVACPVALFNVRHDRAAIRFNLINPDTGNRIRMVVHDAETDQELSRRDLVKGYEFKKNHYLLLTDEDFESVRIESSSVMTVEKFVEAGSIDPLYYDTSYYAAPDGDAGRDVYAVLHKAIERTGRVALSRVVIGQRERTVALRPGAGGLIAHTLHEQRDLNDARAVFSDALDVTIDPEMVTLATQLIDRRTSRYDPGDIEDRYETRLRAMIEAKLKGAGLEEATAIAPPVHSNVIDLMAALKRSLGQIAEQSRPKSRSRPSQAAPAKPARKPSAASQAAKPSRGRA